MKINAHCWRLPPVKTRSTSLCLTEGFPTSSWNAPLARLRRIWKCKAEEDQGTE